jgi:hypothetical protein
VAVLSCLVLSCLVLSCLALPCLVLSCFVLSYFVLSSCICPQQGQEQGHKRRRNEFIFFVCSCREFLSSICLTLSLHLSFSLVMNCGVIYILDAFFVFVFLLSCRFALSKKDVLDFVWENTPVSTISHLSHNALVYNHLHGANIFEVLFYLEFVFVFVSSLPCQCRRCNCLVFAVVSSCRSLACACVCVCVFVFFSKGPNKFDSFPYWLFISSLVIYVFFLIALLFRKDKFAMALIQMRVPPASEEGQCLNLP